jgi:hypothetical protein
MDTAAPAGKSIIAISRRNLIQDLVRTYAVFIDERQVGTVSPWRTRRFVVDPGQHVVRLRVGSRYSSSDEVPVDVPVGQVETLRTWSRLRRLPFSLNGFVTVLVNPNGYGLGPTEWDPFGLWGNPRPWITLSRDKPKPGPRRFDAGGPEPTKPSPGEENALIRFLDESQFSLVRHGYRIDDVDRFIAKVKNQLEVGEVLTGQEVSVSFDTAFKGYAKPQVDVFMESLRTNLS